MDLEVVGDRCSLAILSDREGELLVQRQSNGFRSVLRLVDLKTDVEVLASEEVGPMVNCLAQTYRKLYQRSCSLVWGEDAACDVVSS